MKNKRTDILEKGIAHEFAEKNTDFEHVSQFLNPTIKQQYTLLKDDKSQNYYIAKVESYEKVFAAGEYRQSVAQIGTNPLKGSNNFVPYISSSQFSFGINATDLDKTHYFNDELYEFKSEQDRQTFERFCLEVGTGEDWEKTLDKLAPYFSDKNFVLMAKDKAFDIAFKIGGNNLSTIGKNLLELKIRREIEKRAKKFAEPEAGGSEKEF